LLSICWLLNFTKTSTTTCTFTFCKNNIYTFILHYFDTTHAFIHISFFFQLPLIKFYFPFCISFGRHCSPHNFHFIGYPFFDSFSAGCPFICSSLVHKFFFLPFSKFLNNGLFSPQERKTLNLELTWVFNLLMWGNGYDHGWKLNVGWISTNGQ
jgi:hypothetical protein